MRFVEQPQFRSASDQACQCCSPPLTCAQTSDRHVGETINQSHPLHSAPNLVGRCAHGCSPEPNVVADRKVGVQTVGVPEQSHLRTDSGAIANEIDSEHRRRPALDGDKARAQAQQRCLAGTVGTAQQHDLAALYGQCCTGQRRETAQHGDHVDELDHDPNDTLNDTLNGRFHLVGDASGAFQVGRFSQQIASLSVASGTEYSSSPLARFRRYRQQRVPHFSRPKPPHDWHWVVAWVGKVLITLGLLMFLFVGYQLWGTGIQTAQAQDRLEDEFRERLAATTTTTAPTTTTIGTDTTTVPSETTTTTTTTSTVPVAAPTNEVPNGDPIAILHIPRLGITWQVVEGVTIAALKDGPGHFPETVLPGQLGNSAIAGHRTTHGEPFRNIDRLRPGDLIELTTLVGTYAYEVTGSVIVKPADYGLVIPTIDPTIATLVLATCDPAYTARNRLIVKATLVPELSGQVYAPPPTTPPTSTVDETIPGEETTTSIDASPDSVATTIASGSEVEGVATSDDVFSDGWFSDPAATPHVLGWGILLLAAGFGAYLVGRALNRLYVCFLVGFVPFTFVLYFWFENVNRLLPPSL